MAETKFEIVWVDGSPAEKAAVDRAVDSGSRPVMPSAAPQGPGRATPAMPGVGPGAASGPKIGERSSPNYREAGSPISAELAKLQKSVSSILGKTIVGSAVGQAVGISGQMAQLMEAIQSRAQRRSPAGDKLPDDAPRREDFRDLKTSLDALRRRLSQRSDRGGIGGPSSGRETRRRRGAAEGVSQEGGLSRRERATIEKQLAETFGDLSKMNPATRASLERELAEKLGYGRKETPAPIEPPGNVERRSGKPPISAEQVSQRSSPGAPPVQTPPPATSQTQSTPPPVQTPPAAQQASRPDPETTFGRLGDRIGRMFRGIEDRAIGAGRRVRTGGRRLGDAWRGTAADVAEGARVVGRRVAGSQVAQGARRGLSAAGRNVSEFGAGLGRTRVGGAIGRGGAAVARRTGMTAAAGAVGRFVAARGATAAATTAVAGGSTAAGASAAAALGGPVGIAVGAVALALGALVVSVKKASDGFARVSDRLEDVSPAIASARASNEIRSERSRIDRANELGPQLANLESARGRLGDAFYKLGTDILSEVLKYGPHLEKLIDGGTVAIEILRLLKETADVGIAAIPGSNMDDVKEQNEVAQALVRLNNSLDEFNRTGGGQQVNEVDQMLRDLISMRVIPGDGIPPNEAP